MKAGMDHRKRWLALIVLCLGDLMIVLDTTIVNVALPSIREDLRAGRQAAGGSLALAPEAGRGPGSA
jgi:hypothetical protein